MMLASEIFNLLRFNAVIALLKNLVWEILTIVNLRTVVLELLKCHSLLEAWLVLICIEHDDRVDKDIKRICRFKHRSLQQF